LEKFPPVEKWGELKSPSNVWSVRFPEQPKSEHRQYDLGDGVFVDTDEASLKREFTSGCVFFVRDDQFDRRPTTEEFELDNKALIARSRGIYGFPVEDPKAETLKISGHFTRDYSWRGSKVGDFDVRRALVIGKKKVRILTLIVGGPAVRAEDRKLFLDSLKIAENP
jgi:hypothetical protein